MSQMREFDDEMPTYLQSAASAYALSPSGCAWEEHLRRPFFWCVVMETKCVHMSERECVCALVRLLEALLYGFAVRGHLVAY